jgi:hypothetical protein
VAPSKEPWEQGVDVVVEMRTFLAVHAREIVAVDFFLAPTLTCRLLFAFVVLPHDRRELVHVSVADQPTAVWTARQILEAFPNETAPRYLLRDRDAIYGECFTRCIANMGVERWSSLSGHPGRTRSTNGSSAQSVASA